MPVDGESRVIMPLVAIVEGVIAWNISIKKLQARYLYTAKLAGHVQAALAVGLHWILAGMEVLHGISSVHTRSLHNIKHNIDTGI